MKKILITMLAAVLAFGTVTLSGCGKTADTTPPTTEQVGTTAPTDAFGDEDLALPAVNDSGSTTAAIVANATTQAVVAQPAPIFKAIAAAQNAPTTTTMTVPVTEAEQTEPVAQTEQEAPDTPDAKTTAKAETTTTTTTKPVETTTKAPAKAELLQNYVLSRIQSGTYTETISAFGKDQCADDKLSKIVTGGQTAYVITIPAAGLSYKVFPSDGKYYLATSTKYCELTKEQYNKICAIFSNGFVDLSGLKYQKTDTVRDGLKKYTCEHFDVGGGDFVLWYSNNELFEMQMGSDTLPMTVSGSADASVFSLADGLEKTDYATLESLVSLAGAFFGE